MKVKTELIKPLLMTACLIPVLSCSPKMDREDYIEWVQDYDNGLHVQKKSAGYIFDVQYLPDTYRQLQAGRPPLPTPSPSQEQSSGDLQHYKLTIRFEDGQKDFIKGAVTTEYERQQRLYYFSYRFQEGIYLEGSDGKLPCMLYHFERASDLRPGRTFVLGFDLGTSAKEAVMVIDSPLFGSVPIKIRISKDNPTNLSL